jgi:hypothetical protein
VDLPPLSEWLDQLYCLPVSAVDLVADQEAMAKAAAARGERRAAQQSYIRFMPVDCRPPEVARDGVEGTWAKALEAGEAMLQVQQLTRVCAMQGHY